MTKPENNLRPENQILHNEVLMRKIMDMTINLAQSN